MNYNMPGFNELVQRRPKYLLKLLKKFQNIIYTDVDTIWLKDPRPYLVGEFDFWAQIDGITSGLPYINGYIPFFCTGFMAFQSSSKTLSLLKKWYQELKSVNVDDQMVFQRTAFEMSANGRVLPTNEFPSGRHYFQLMCEKERKHAVVIHNNFIVGKQQKISRFKEWNLWVPTLTNGK